MSGWRDVHVGFEGDGVMIGGVAIWRQAWRRVGEAPLDLPHPGYPHQLHCFNIYQVGSVDDPVRFAAAELSNGVWGFYVPAT
jgi:hypothetical protein